jgi:hypothetical protein
MGRPITEEKQSMTREEVAKQIQSLEENSNFKPGAKGEAAPSGKEFKEGEGKRKHVGRGGMKD